MNGNVLLSYPSSFSQDLMITLLNRFIPNQFDFFYMPVDFKTNCNLGFGYVSVTSSEALLQLYSRVGCFHWDFKLIHS